MEYPNAGQQKLSISRDSLGRVTAHTYTLGNGTTGPTDTVTRSQSGQVTSGTELGQTKTYTYDKAGRLTAATIGANTYAYSFGAQDVSCTGNPTSGKNSNRTSQTVNSITTIYCYDQADRLISSSDLKLTNLQYDTHGNTTSLGTSPVTTLTYDSSDRNTKITEATKSTIYQRDAQDRLTKRTHTDGTTTTTNKYAYTSNSDTPDLLLDTNNGAVEKYLQLPGGVLLTIRPNDKVYSLSNIHSDTMATTDANGALVSTFQYDPFGNTTTNPNNTAQGSTFGWVGQHEKVTEAGLTLNPTQMGARLYLPTLGRFTQVDPVEGGGANNYSYPTDPVNDFDLTGQWWGEGVVKQYAKDLATYNPVTGIYGAAYNTYRAVQSPKNYALDTARVAGSYLPVGGVASKAGKIGSWLFGRVKPDGTGIKGIINSGRWLRIGQGWNGSQEVFRISIGCKTCKILGKQIHKHIDLWRHKK